MNLLKVIEKYNYGIIGALVVHMILFIWFNIGNMSFTIIDPPEKTIAILDYTNTNLEEKTKKSMPDKKNQDENGKEIINITTVF